MKHVIFQFVFIFLLWIFASSDASKQNDLLERYLNKKCTRPQAKKVSDQIKIVSSELERAFADIPDNMEHFCKTEKEKLEALSKTARVEFEKCLSSDESYLPWFIQNNFNGLLHFLCIRYADNVRKLYSADGQLCMTELKKENATKDLDVCFGGILEPSENSPVSEKDMCKNLGIVQNCFHNVIGHHCSNPKLMQLLNKNLFEDNISTVFQHDSSNPCNSVSSSFRTGALWFTVVLLAIFRML